MKPNFSLILSSEGLQLLHRARDGWARVGDVGFASSDLAADLAALQERAARLPGDATCKLILPEDQIKYMTIEASGDPDAAVRAALEGATPYAVDELEYDWTAEDGVIHVAAVALETLGEAESFAVEHGFEPVSFAAIPEGPVFRGEPFFGVTAWAGTALPEGTQVERDAAPIRITGEAEIPAENAPDEDIAEDEDAPVAAAATQAVAEAGPAPKPKAPEVQPEAPPAASDAKKDTAPASGAPEPSVAAFSSIRASRGLDGAPRPPLAADGPRLSRLGGADAGAKEGMAPSLPSPADDGPSDPAMMAELAASLRPDPEARLDRDAAEEAAPARNGSDPDRGAGLFAMRGAKPAKEKPRASKAIRRDHDEKQRMTVFGARQSEVRGKPRFLGLILTAILLLFLVGVAAWASVFLDDGLARLFRGGDIKLADVPAVSEAEVDPVVQEDDAPAPALIAPLPAGDAKDEEERTAALTDAGTERPEVATLPSRPTVLSPSEALASYAATGIWQMAPTAPETPGAGAPLSDLYEVSLDPGLALELPGTLPRRQPDARDTALETPADPPPAGTRFDFDARGLVRATPEGALTPEGVRVIAGRPPLMPPAEMEQTVTVTAAVPVEETGEAEITQIQIDPALANVRPRARPETPLTDAAEPEEETDAEQADGAPDTSIAGTRDGAIGTAASLAALRPQPRPAEMSAAAATLQTASAGSTVPLVDGAALTRALTEATAQPQSAAAATSAADPEELDDASFENATPQAVTASLTPLKRPGDFDTTVKRTQEAVAAQPVPQSQQMQVSLPSSASVASQATEKNVLNMREVNLIGVYGSPASRRALVRLGNGRYQKVRVGDTLDGGQVAAIGEGELRYIKRGRNVVLRMPQG
ncbi:hypothetical protein [Roseovarius aquimarinus]|uniref:Type IV pilus biogenesis n=1 Tax=Roseovarius aquimarinus TaxID=1229156 RepID=A0ABW7I5C1_9RHOB